MEMPNDFFAELKNFFQKLPGIGPRQARRFVYKLVDFSEEERNKMGEAILSLDKYLKRCESCFRIFHLDIGRLSRRPMSFCSFCDENSRRDNSKIMVVEKDSDVLSFEKSGVHNGLYFVLGGLFDPLDENQTPKIRIEKLKKFPLLYKDPLRRSVSEARGSGEVEIVLALPSTKIGDFTCEYIKKIIPAGVAKITRLAKGLSSGVELEYADENTLKHAFLNRK